MREPFATLFHEHAAGALEKQSHLGSLLGNREWHLDLPGGCIEFGDDLEFQCQVLGTEATTVGRWNWAWSGAISGIPPMLLKACAAVQAEGMERGISELTEPDVDLAGLSGNHLAMVASGIYDADAYFRCGHPQGAVYVLVKDADFLRMRTLDPLRFKAVFEQLLMNFPLEPRKALDGYLKFHGVQAEEKEGRLVGEVPGGSRLVLDLEDDGKIKRIDLVGPTAATGNMKMSLSH